MTKLTIPPSRSGDWALHALLVILFFLFFIVYPLVGEAPVGLLVIETFLSLVLLLGALELPSRPLRRIGILVAFLTVVTRAVTYAGKAPGLVEIHTLLTIAFLWLVIAGLTKRVFTGDLVTVHRIEGAIAIYLLVGLVFSQTYLLIELTRPGSFGGLPSETSIGSRQFGYFSFVTLTTVGYGDVTPLSPVARQMAVLEALIGQLYPAVLLARLVSLSISRSEKESSP